MQKRLNSKQKKKLLILSFLFFFSMTALITLVSVSLAALTPTESIEILSENLNYENKEQGSWKIKKSASWISNDKIKVSYDISTEKLEKETNMDLLLVVNTSNYLTDEQFSTMKNSLNEVTDSILSNGSSSRVALVSFNYTYYIESDFSSDKSNILDGINNLTRGTGSSYYNGFQGVDEVLSNYQTIGENKLNVIFLTCSLPNKHTPNEIAEYNYLKSKYQDLTINAVTYNMSTSVLDQIKDISDKQFVATDDNLSEVLLTATDMQYNYEKFTIDDYIDTDNFNIENLDSLRINYGSASLDSDSSGKKIAINLDNLVSGTEVNISYEMNLNNNTDRVFAVNKSIKVNTSLLESEEDIVSEKTPALASNYKVSYVSNAPDGCSVTVPSAKYYSVFDTVKISADLVCNGYQFRGWKLVSDKDVTMINDDNFLMPESDVVIKGTWSKLSITKSMDGTVYTPQTLNNIIENQAVLDNIKSTYVSSETGIDFSQVSSLTNGRGVYTMASTKDDEFPIHYYRGDVSNNFVKYAGYCWRIVRTTETGGVKLIYYGSPDSSTGSCSNDSSPLSAKSASTSIGILGYMSGDSYESTSRYMSKWYTVAGKGRNGISEMWYTILGKTERLETGVASGLNDSTKYYYYGTEVTYSSGKYQLSGTVKKLKAPQTSLGTSLAGRYTCFKTTNSSCTSVGYIVSSPKAASGSNKGEFYYIWMSDGETYDSLHEDAKKVTWLYSDDVIYENDQYELDNNSLTEFHPFTEDIHDKYTCYSESETCTTVSYVLSSSHSSEMYSSYYVEMENGETYDTLYESIMIDENIYVYGNDISYDDSTNTYTLIDPVSSYTFEWDEDYDNALSGHHYTCYNNQTSCQEIYYITNVDSNSNAGIILTGGKTINDVYNSLNENTYDSKYKSEIDEWYARKLTKYQGYLEDTVYCNDRQIRELGFFNKDSKLTETMLFNTKYRLDNNIPSIICSNVNDSFSVSDTIGNGKLTYPIGLITADEIVFSGNNFGLEVRTYNALYGSATSTMSPYESSGGQATVASIYGNQFVAHSIGSSIGLRPVVSLKNSLMVYAGDGTSTRPYILENPAKKITILTNKEVKPSVGSALPGDTVYLRGPCTINSFKMNGEVITGSSFTMPDSEAIISDISFTVESEHDPYPDDMNEKVYAENTFEGATSLTVEITYQIQTKLFNTYYDYVSIYDKTGTNVSGKLSSSNVLKKTTKTFTITGDYIKITFTSNSSLNDYYGFKAIITPNYG